ncbi:unnamed protein product, partial [Orchesella dallaii]
EDVLGDKPNSLDYSLGSSSGRRRMLRGVHRSLLIPVASSRNAFGTPQYTKASSLFGFGG